MSNDMQEAETDSDETYTALKLDDSLPHLVDPNSIIGVLEIPGLNFNAVATAVIEMLAVKGVPCIVQYQAPSHVETLLEDSKRDDPGAEVSVAVAFRFFWHPKSSFTKYVSELVLEKFSENKIFNSQFLALLNDDEEEVLREICDHIGFTDIDAIIYSLSEYTSNTSDVPIQDFPKALDMLGTEQFPWGGYWTSTTVRWTGADVEAYKEYLLTESHTYATLLVETVRNTLDAA